MRSATATAAVVAAAVALLLSACGPGGSARRARLEAQRAHLEASLDRLEARLLDGQARVRGWQELKVRHAQVTAVACQVNARHVEDMARLQVEAGWQAAGARAPKLAAALAPAQLTSGDEPPGAGGD